MRPNGSLGSYLKENLKFSFSFTKKKLEVIFKQIVICELSRLRKLCCFHIVSKG